MLQLSQGGHPVCDLSCSLRVDSAFICLGTTRAKAGAEGFVKVTPRLVILLPLTTG